MNVGEYLKGGTCSTELLKVLSRQIAEELFKSTDAGKVVTISEHVNIAGGSTLPYLQRNAAVALANAIKEFGRKPRLVHALRVLPQQYALYDQYIHHRCGIPLAAAPGTSPHERGVAIDLNDWEDWIPVLRRHQWIWRGAADKPHFNFHGDSDPDFGHYGIRAFQYLWNKHNPNDLLKADGVIGPKTIEKLMLSPVSGWNGG